MKNKIFIFVILLLFGHSSLCQKKIRYPLWYIPDKNIEIDGIAIGPFSYWMDENSLIQINGIKIELIGWGIILPLVPKHPFLDNNGLWIEDSLNRYSSTCNGLAISSFGIAHPFEKINGVQLSGLCSYTGQVNPKNS